MPKRLNLAGQRFGRLVVKSFSHVSKKRRYWRCFCDCGNIKIAMVSNLRKGATNSCGCLRSEVTSKLRPGIIHDMSRTGIYRIWKNMRERCRNFHNLRYGGRGIKVCERWHKFENFLDDMGEQPAGLSIDRIDNDGNYEPGNCRWATPVEQNNNTSRKRLITLNGEIHTIADWERIQGFTKNTIGYRIRRGWSHKKAVFTPVKKITR